MKTLDRETARQVKVIDVGAPERTGPNNARRVWNFFSGMFHSYEFDPLTDFLGYHREIGAASAEGKPRDYYDIAAVDERGKVVAAVAAKDLGTLGTGKRFGVINYAATGDDRRLRGIATDLVDIASEVFAENAPRTRPGTVELGTLEEAAGESGVSYGRRAGENGTLIGEIHSPYCRRESGGRITHAGRVKAWGGMGTNWDGENGSAEEGSRVFVDPAGRGIGIYDPNLGGTGTIHFHWHVISGNRQVSYGELKEMVRANLVRNYGLAESEVESSAAYRRTIRGIDATMQAHNLDESSLVDLLPARMLTGRKSERENYLASARAPG